MTLRDALQSELTAALQRRDRPVTSALRTALAAIANAEAAPVVDPIDGAIGSAAGSVHVAGATAGLGATEVDRRTLTEEQQRALVVHEQIELTAHAERLAALCRREEADGVRRAAQALDDALADSRAEDVRTRPAG